MNVTAAAIREIVKEGFSVEFAEPGRGLDNIPATARVNGCTDFKKRIVTLAPYLRDNPPLLDRTAVHEFTHVVMHGLPRWREFIMGSLLNGVDGQTLNHWSQMTETEAEVTTEFVCKTLKVDQPRNGLLQHINFLHWYAKDNPQLLDQAEAAAAIHGPEIVKRLSEAT